MEYPEEMDDGSFPEVDAEFLDQREEGVGSRLLRLLKAEGRDKEARIVETIIEEN
jgi:hypothetical protein